MQNHLPNPLTAEQTRVLNHIIKHRDECGFPPSVREIAQELGYKSANNVRQHLRLIERKGYIRIAEGRARGIEVLCDSRGKGHGQARPVRVQPENIRAGSWEESHENGVPLVGMVAAGTPITAVENLEGYLTLDRTMFKGEDLFALRVRGESMKDIGIFDNDIAVIRKKTTADNGEVVVAVVNDEATLKRFIKKSDHIVLKAENLAFKDIIVPQGENIHIAGKLVGVIRKM
ncbi:MAG: transcriptional repressor LexA [Chitinispirillales bacterium]|jgi:repressor LexA|nr:transcriptional repressor LexA [Chitinispirillales bacterium]